MATADKPNVLLLSLSYRKFLDETYDSLLSRLLNVSNLKRAKKSSGALRILSECTFKAIIITDEGLTYPENREVLAKVKGYIENGGLAIVGLHFPNFTTQDQFDDFFKAFDLPWRRGDYHRTTFEFVQSSEIPKGLKRSSFLWVYSMRVVHVKNGRPRGKIFVPIPGAITEGLVLCGFPVDRTHAAVVGTMIGQGALFTAEM